MLETFTIRPAGALPMSGKSFLVNATGAKKFVSNVSRKISGDTALTGFGPEPGCRNLVFLQHAGVINQNIQSPVLFGEVIVRLLMVLRSGNIKAQTFRGNAFVAKLRSCGFAFFRVA